MNFRCSELQGAIYQPKGILEIANCWVIPACKGGPVLEMPDLKLVFVYQEDTKKGNEALEEYLFAHCYQFLFCSASDIYRQYSIRQLNRSESFVLTGADINHIEKQIRDKYVEQDNTFSIDFNNIKSFYCPLLPSPVNFNEFYGKFTELFILNSEFKEIITLFCETINGVRILYDNTLQKIAQFQTILDVLLDRPKPPKCDCCGQDKYDETWRAFLKRRLEDYQIMDVDEICLITKIRTTLNKARIKFIHYAEYYNPNELRHFIADIKTDRYSDYKFDINQVLKKDPKSWSSMDWRNVYQYYLVIVRYLIYLNYFEA